MPLTNDSIPCRGLLHDCEIFAKLHLTFVSSSNVWSRDSEDDLSCRCASCLRSWATSPSPTVTRRRWRSSACPPGWCSTVWRGWGTGWSPPAAWSPATGSTTPGTSSGPCTRWTWTQCLQNITFTLHVFRRKKTGRQALSRWSRVQENLQVQ